MSEELKEQSEKLNELNTLIRQKQTELTLMIAQRNDLEKDIEKKKHLKNRFGLKSL
ncbi:MULTISPECIES: hypothetical protein [Bacillus]|uniref:hypothetical protein n=1 Tax=Bacillus TaxID=1386 RepID=UPI0015DF80D0|nr:MULTISPECIES: hypothetical protein [Bacillus]MCP1159367.1 hypothetical protein [Bacillus infantis]MDT0160353.1 hypothetical protein [Bacillus sp. AG4(2022)]